VWTEKCPPVEDLAAWLDSGFKNKKKRQKIARFPGMVDVVNKFSLTASLNRISRYFEDDFAFNPKSFVLPGE
jgi:hypothetical protein